jgi:hypothetical protein
MQATVDSSGRFMEYSLRPGSCSDKNLWTMSSFGQNVAGILKRDMHLVGDAGYTLSDNLMIPYEITDNMPRSERQFNYFHSCTRIAVERAFGLLKNRWRILNRTLNMKTPSSAGRTIVACLVLHNLTINAKDSINIPDPVDPYLHCHYPVRESPSNRQMALAKRDQIKSYLMTVHGIEEDDEE